jgi:hypothetical protein
MVPYQFSKEITMGLTEADQKKINGWKKETTDLLKFEKLLRTVGLYGAIITLWDQVDEALFGPLTFEQWLELWQEAPLYHPLKSLAPERMALQAGEDLAKWKIIWGKSRPYTKLAEQAEFMVAKLQTLAQNQGKE